MNNWSIICGALPWIEHHAARQLSQLMETRQLSQDSICLWHRESNNHFLKNYEQCFSKTTKWKECWSFERDILLINWLIADCVNSTWAADIFPLRRIFLWYFSSSPFPAAWQGRQFEVRGEQMAGSLLLSHTRTWLGHNITHISFRWSISIWGESRFLVIHYLLVSGEWYENLFIAMVRRMENCTQSCLKAIARWVQFPLKLISFVTKAAPELERVRDVCWWKKKHQVFVWTNDVVDFWCSVPKQSICVHESKVFYVYCAQTKYPCMAANWQRVVVCVRVANIAPAKGNHLASTKTGASTVYDWANIIN